MTIDDRIAAVISRRRSRVSTNGAGQARIEARTRVLEELPRMTARLSAAVAEVNDRLGDAHFWIQIAAGERTPASEAAFEIGIVGDPGEGATLGISADYTGKLSCVVRHAHGLAVIRTSTIFDTQTPDFVEVLVAWLEARYA